MTKYISFIFLYSVLSAPLRFVTKIPTSTISVMSALLQTLAYMMANPQPDKPIFGMMTKDGIIFVKLTQQDRPQYDI